jgi:hypothetical protein
MYIYIYIPFTPESTFLTLRSQPSQSILTLRATVCICFFFLPFLALLSKSDKYSRVPATPIFSVSMGDFVLARQACFFKGR